VALLDLSHFATFQPVTGRRRSRRARRLRVVRPSLRVELYYRAELYRLVGMCEGVGAAILEQVRPHFAGHGLDARKRLPETEQQLGEAARIVARKLTSSVGKRSVVKRALAEVDKRLAGAVEVSIGINIAPLLAAETGGAIAAAIEEAAAANVALIESIPAEYLARVRGAVTQAFSRGLRHEALAEEIQRIGEVTKRRAKLIARDQLSKLNASFNQVRQTSVGIKQYRWSGALDKRERPSHRAMEGTLQRWDSPPLVDGEHVHPGEAIPRLLRTRVKRSAQHRITQCLRPVAGWRSASSARATT
jgi:SPP1 gp7 family putative phage head morphogenesis protein